MGSDQCFSLAKEMYVCDCDQLPGAKYRTQADLEKSFFGSGKGEVIEFGADQCKHFVCDISFCINFSIQVYSCATTLQGTGYNKGLETVSSCQFLGSVLAICLNHPRRTLYESKGLEFNDVSLDFLYIFPLPTKPRSYCTTSSEIPWRP